MTAGRQESAHSSSARQEGQSRPTRGEGVPEHPQPKRSRRSIWRLWLFRLTALIVIPAILLLLLELSLRIFGFGYPTDFVVKTQVNDQTVYVYNPDFHRRFFPKGLGRSPDPFLIPAVKPEQTYRIFILGGSAAKGTPEPTFGFGRILEVQLRDRFPQAGFEVLNCSATAINSHVALQIARDCAALEPDLFIVYLGNNEVVGPFGAGTVLAPFSPNLSAIRAGLLLRSTRIGQLAETLLAPLATKRTLGRWKGMQMFLDNQVAADAPALETVYQHFRHNLSDLCCTAEKSDIPAILCTVATNLKDCPPFASLHHRDLSDDDRKKWDAVYQQAVAHETKYDYAQAIELYLSATEVDDRYADLHYRLGRCYWAIGDYQKARESFVQGREFDTLRFRADTRINDIIRTVANGKSSRSTYLTDIERTFTEASPHSSPGEELFHEHVHLNFKGNVLLATTVLRQVERLLPDWVKRSAAVNRPLLTERECAERLAFTAWERYRVTDQVLNSFVKQPPFINRLYQDELVDKIEKKLSALDISTDSEALELVDAQYRRAIQSNSSDIWLRFNYVSFLLKAAHDLNAAEEQLRVCLRGLPVHADALNQLGSALVRQGELGQAQTFFRRALQIACDNVEIRANLAQALALEGEFDEAFEEFETAMQLDPENASTHHSLGVVLTMQGRTDDAIRHLRRALEIRPGFAEAHSNLGHALLTQGNLNEAIGHFRQALQARPDDAAAHHSLAVALRSQGKPYEAIGHFRQALQIMPADPKTHYHLGLALAMIGRLDEAVGHLREALRRNPGWPAPSNQLAWILATCQDPTIRNGAEAVRLAQQACRVKGYRDPRFLDTLAAAYAEVGRFTDAVQTVRKAISLTPSENQGLIAEREQRLKLYESGRPYRAGPRSSPY